MPQLCTSLRFNWAKQTQGTMREINDEALSGSEPATRYSEVQHSTSGTNLARLRGSQQRVQLVQTTAEKSSVNTSLTGFRSSVISVCFKMIW